MFELWTAEYFSCIYATWLSIYPFTCVWLLTYLFSLLTYLLTYLRSATQKHRICLCLGYFCVYLFINFMTKTCLNFEQYSIFHASMPLGYVFTRLLVLGYLGLGEDPLWPLLHRDWFIAAELYRQYNLTMTGTLQANRKHIPEELKSTKGRQPTSSVFCFNDMTTLVSYCPKNNRNVILLSTEHHDEQTKRRRRDFLYDLGVALVRPYLANRAANPVGLQLPLRPAIQTVTGEPVVDPSSHSVPTSSEEDQPPVKRGRCCVCSHTFAGTGESKQKKSQKANKSQYRCSSCNYWTCLKHSTAVKDVQYICNLCHKWTHVLNVNSITFSTYFSIYPFICTWLPTSLLMLTGTPTCFVHTLHLLIYKFCD